MSQANRPRCEGCKFWEEEMTKENRASIGGKASPQQLQVFIRLTACEGQWGGKFQEKPARFFSGQGPCQIHCQGA